MAEPTEFSLRNRKAPSTTIQTTPDKSFSMIKKPAFQYDLQEETMMTPAHTRAVSPTRGHVMPHTAAEADAFTTNSNSLVSSDEKDKFTANAGALLTNKTRAYLGHFSPAEKAGLALYAVVLALTMVATTVVAVKDHGCATIFCMTVAGVGLFGFGLMLVVLRLQDRPLVKHADLEA